MTTNPTSCELSVADAKAALKKFIRLYDRCTRDTQTLYLHALLAFLESLQRSHPNPPGAVVITESRLMEWMAELSTAKSFANAVQKTQLVGHFMHHLNEAGAIRANPMASIRSRYGKRGWAGIIRALRSHDTTAALAQIRVEPTFSGSFGDCARTYIALHRAAGKKYRANEMVLIDFNRFLRQRGADSIESVTSAIVRRWADRCRASQKSRRRRLHVLRQFFGYARSLKKARTNPVTAQLLDEIGIPRRTFRPYIFTADQIRALLEASRKLARTRMFPLRPEVMHTTISLLYTLGLRISEVVKLSVGDVDRDREALLIRETKFFKERYVPYGPRLGRLLERYLDVRRTVTPALRKQDPVFVGWAARRVTVHLIRKHLKEAMNDAGIGATNGSTLPRVHDLRHTFAVHRLLRWYREGVNVQKRLVLLSTFMGHLNIYGTQPYLTVTGALLDEANDRFHTTFGEIAHPELPS